MVHSQGTMPPAELSPLQIEAARRRTVPVIAAAGATIVACLAFVKLGRAPDAAVERLDMLRIALFATAAVVIFTSTVVKGFMLRSAPSDPAARLARIRGATVAAGVMAEVPTLLGLVLFLLGGKPSDVYLLAVVSLYMLVRHFPRRGPWHEYVQGRSGVRSYC